MNPLRLLLLLLTACTLHAATARKPNFVFIYTDDQRFDAMGVVQREQGDRARFPWLKTPNMDRLAAEGLRFRNAFVTLSLCAPSRAAFMTGRYNHLNGVANNHTPFPEDNITHASLLKTAGYTTAYIGKWHMGSQSGKRPTFDYSASFIGQGRYVDCPIEVNGVSTPSQGWVDDVTTDYAINFIKQHREQPFSVVLGFKATHGPFDPPARAKTRFEGEKARPVPNLGIPAIYRRPVDQPMGKPAQDFAEGKVNLNYFRCISAADDNLGRVLQALDDLGLTEDTVVIFSSDNGYYNGEHGLGDKRSCYEESLRIPMLVRYPRLIAKGTTRDEMVLNIDLAPTLIDLAGVAVPRTMQGASWKPLLAGQPAPGWRQSFFAEYFQEAQYPQTPTVFAVRTPTAKLIKYEGHNEWNELFDLSKDPYETNNLVQDPAHQELLLRMITEYDRAAKAVDFRIPAYADKPTDAPTKKGKGKKKG
jgi:arylsulfatase A-like enzyme